MNNFTKLLLIFCFLISLDAVAQPFVTKWDLGNPLMPPTSFIVFQAETIGNVNYTWETIPAGSNGTGTFTGFGGSVYIAVPIGSTIRLSIDTTNFRRFISVPPPVGNSFDRLVDVEQWGGVHWSSMANAFYSCYGLNISATDIPNLNAVTSMERMFASCVNLTTIPNINNWDISNVTDLSRMFIGAVQFNQPIGNWNTSSVTNMFSMFENAYIFNQPLGNWNTSSVTNMYSMFENAQIFNQPIGNWNTGNVLNMNSMFRGATLFNQPIGSWNTSNVSSMREMFQNATSFNQPLSGFNLLGCQSSYLPLINMLDSCGMDCSNYSATLYSWNANALTPDSMNLGAVNMQYGNNVQAVHVNLTLVKGWTIVGDTMSNNNCCFSLITSLSNTTCTSYFFNGQNLTSSGTYYDTLLNVNGCDSIISLNLTINQSTSSTINQATCTSYFFNGQTLTTNGTYYDTLLNVNGCDSIISLNLTVNQVNISVTQLGANLSANSSGATYQWLSCNPYQIISGATNQTFTANANGDYAVIVTENGCTDTSACVTVMGIGLDEYSNDDKIIIYPNPAQDIIYISSNLSAIQNTKKELYNTLGQVILTTYENEIDVSNFVKGVYYVRCGQFVTKVIVE